MRKWAKNASVRQFEARGDTLVINGPVESVSVVKL